MAPGGHHRVCCCPTVPEWPPLVLPDPVCAPPADCPTTTLILEPGACHAPVTQLVLPRFLWWGFPAEMRTAIYVSDEDMTYIRRYYRKVHPDELWRIGPGGFAWFATECHHSSLSSPCAAWQECQESIDIFPSYACHTLGEVGGAYDRLLLSGLISWETHGWPEIKQKIVYGMSVPMLRHTMWGVRTCESQKYWLDLEAYEYNDSPPAYDIQFPNEATYDSASFTWPFRVYYPHAYEDRFMLLEAPGLDDVTFGDAGRVCPGLTNDPRLGFHYDPDTGAPVGHRPDWDVLASPWEFSHDDPVYGLCEWSLENYKTPGILYVRILETLPGDQR